MPTTPTSPDALVGGGGSIYTVTPMTDAAREWIDEYVTGEQQWLGRSLAVEHRYIADLVAGMQSCGLTVQ